MAPTNPAALAVDPQMKSVKPPPAQTPPPRVVPAPSEESSAAPPPGPRPARATGRPANRSGPKPKSKRPRRETVEVNIKLPIRTYMELKVTALENYLSLPDVILDELRWAEKHRPRDEDDD